MEEFPSKIPDQSDTAGIRKLLVATLDKLPKSNTLLAKEISHAMATG